MEETKDPDTSLALTVAALGNALVSFYVADARLHHDIEDQGAFAIELTRAIQETCDAVAKRHCVSCKKKLKSRISSLHTEN